MKQIYLDRQTAKVSAKRKSLNYYRCLDCGYYHLTHYSKKKTRGVLRDKIKEGMSRTVPTELQQLRNYAKQNLLK